MQSKMPLRCDFKIHTHTHNTFPNELGFAQIRNRNLLTLARQQQLCHLLLPTSRFETSGHRRFRATHVFVAGKNKCQQGRHGTLGMLPHLIIIALSCCRLTQRKLTFVEGSTKAFQKCMHCDNTMFRDKIGYIGGPFFRRGPFLSGSVATTLPRPLPPCSSLPGNN